MSSNKSTSKPIQHVTFLNTLEMYSDTPLNDLEVKSFFLLAGIIMAIIPDLLTGAFGLRAPIVTWILINLLPTILHHLSKYDSTESYVDNWKQVVWKLNVALFEVGMGLSGLTVLALWMLLEACQWIFVFSLALPLTALALAWEGGVERHGRTRAAFGELSDQLRSCDNVADVFEYLAS